MLVSKGSDKSVFRGANKISKIGTLSSSIFDECLRRASSSSSSDSVSSGLSILSKPTSTYEQCKKWAESKNASDLFMEILPRRASSSSSSDSVSSGLSILSKPTSTYEQCKKWAESKNASDLFMEILPILYNTAVENGVDPTLVVAQCAKETVSSGLSILSKQTATYEQCKKWAESKNASDLFMEILPILYNTAVENGVDPTLVVAQCAKETGYCKFGGVLDASFKNASFKNPCGLKTPGGGGDKDKNAHTRFDSWEDGVLAQVQHLALYAGKEGYPLSNPKDPRHFADLFGKCKTVKSLSNNWAGSGYGHDLEKMMIEIKSK